MAGFTNIGKAEILDGVFKGSSLPANFYIHLVTDTPDDESQTLSDLSEVPQANGYTPTSVARNSTDFDTGATEVDASGYSYIRIKDISWTAASGSIPSTGTGALFAVLTDANSTESARKVWAFWSLGSARTVSDTQQLILQDLELRLTES